MFTEVVYICLQKLFTYVYGIHMFTVYICLQNNQLGDNIMKDDMDNDYGYLFTELDEDTISNIKKLCKIEGITLEEGMKRCLIAGLIELGGIDPATLKDSVSEV